jgi:hypothetical protein
LNVPGLAFGAVHDHVAQAGVLLFRAAILACDAPPLAAGRETAPAAAPQPRTIHHIDRRGGTELGGPQQAQTTDVGREVLVEGGERRVGQQERHVERPIPPRPAPASAR